jgi:hypothetical protein
MTRSALLVLLLACAQQSGRDGSSRLAALLSHLPLLLLLVPLYEGVVAAAPLAHSHQHPAVPAGCTEPLAAPHLLTL